MSVSLSTHVLDTAASVAPSRRSSTRTPSAGETDADGRLHLADDLAPGSYALVFRPPSPFFTRVELQLELSDGHYHVPLLASPYGCVTYRGS